MPICQAQIRIQIREKKKKREREGGRKENRAPRSQGRAEEGASAQRGGDVPATSQCSARSPPDGEALHHTLTPQGEAARRKQVFSFLSSLLWGFQNPVLGVMEFNFRHRTPPGATHNHTGGYWFL